MAKIIASIDDGRVVPWFSEEDPVPPGYVVVPLALHAKFAAGEIPDGIALAKAALAADAEVGTVKPDESVEAPARRTRKAAARSAAKDAAEEPVEPGFPSVSHLPKQESML